MLVSEFTQNTEKMISELSSKALLDQLPQLSGKLFLSLKSDVVLNALLAIGETSPDEWLKLAKGTSSLKTVSWQDYIGRYFLELNNTNLSDDEFEDRCFTLLKVIGFKKVKQFGHTVNLCKGVPYPDGEAHIDDDIVIVYDCKNSSNFSPGIDQNEKLRSYINNAKDQYKEKEVYGIFIAKDFNQIQGSEFLYCSVSDLVYILYKKLKLGIEFDLLPMRKIIKKKYSLSQRLIGNEWSE